MKNLGHLIGKKRLSRFLGYILFAASLLVCIVAMQASETVFAASGGREASDESLPYPATPTPTKTPIRTATPTAIGVPKPVQLTEGGCCSYPSWSLDSRWIPFLDRPSPDSPAGLYAVPVNGGEVSLIVDRVGIFSRDWSRVPYNQEGKTFVERWADGQRWEIPNDGHMVRFSSSGRMIEWEIMSQGIAFPDLRQRAIWLARYDGSNAHEVVTVNGGEFVGWTDDEKAIIVTGRLAPYGPCGIWKIVEENGAGRLLLEIENPRSPLLSPVGEWVAFIVSFNPNDELNGLWVVRTDGSMAKKLDLFGAYRWRREGVLLVMPLDIEVPGTSLWQVDVQSGDAWKLFDPMINSLQITSNDWQPAPDGTRIVYRSPEDLNLWVVELPEP